MCQQYINVGEWRHRVFGKLVAFSEQRKHDSDATPPAQQRERNRKRTMITREVAQGAFNRILNPLARNKGHTTDRV